MLDIDIVWASRYTDRKFVWWYYLVPLDIKKGRSGGRTTWNICLGFVWTGFWVIHID